MCHGVFPRRNFSDTCIWKFLKNKKFTPQEIFNIYSIIHESVVFHEYVYTWYVHDQHTNLSIFQSRIKFGSSCLFLYVGLPSERRSSENKSVYDFDYFMTEIAEHRGVSVDLQMPHLNESTENLKGGQSGVPGIHGRDATDLRG